MGNVNMEAYQVHYKGDESVADHLRQLDLDVKKAAALPDLPTTEGKTVLTAITDSQGDTELTYEAPEVESEDIAPAFSEETAYSEGDLVYYDGLLYKFEADHTAGVWDPSEVTQTSAAAEFNELKNTLGDLKVDLMTKLWENPSPTAEFSPQNIELSSSDYDMLLWIYCANVTSSYPKYLSNITFKGKSVTLDNAEYTGSSPNYVASNRTRYCTCIDNTHYSISNCFVTAGNSTDNNMCAPIAIYGIKTTISVRISSIA